MDFELPAEDDPRRVAVRRWLDEHPSPSDRELAEAGLVAPHWPRPWGLDADPEHQLIVDDELRRAGVRRPVNLIGIGWAGPTLLHAGTEQQKQRYLMPLLAGEEVWCQLFSEPGAGSDLAALSTRAVRDGDEWVVTGQKIWTSLAQHARFGILIARTGDSPAADGAPPGAVAGQSGQDQRGKHSGISYFVCPMDAPGITIRPIIEMTGAHTFNEVFLDQVRIPAENLVGEVGEGWALAKVTLSNERVTLSTGGALWGMGPTAGDLLDVVRAQGGLDDPLLRHRLVQLHVESELLRLIRLRTVSAAIRGEAPGPEASIRKVLADEHGQHVFGLAKDLAGAGGMLVDQGPLGAPVGVWHHGFLFSRALTVGGGTGEVQRNIIAERVLGLPHEPDVGTGGTEAAWARDRATAGQLGDQSVRH
ncbi:MAG: acyl-CoA dehydrogenase family protein [Acidimicrobiales bacterium]|nr:acyl-CoA dehydrogenase family protein [Acidimicrobiales bacterium]